MEKDELNREINLLVIGGSAGSLEVTLKILSGLTLSLNFAVVIVLHRKATHDTSLTDLMANQTMLTVKEAEEKEDIKPGMVYLAPANYHLLIEMDHTFSIDSSEKVLYSRPSIDVTFQTAAEVYGSSLAALVLSGANADGSQGLKAIAKVGGLTIVQDPASAEVNYMPEAAIAATPVDYVLEAKDLTDFINSLSASQLQNKQ